MRRQAKAVNFRVSMVSVIVACPQNLGIMKASATYIDTLF